MADMHILTANNNGQFRVVMHFPVPSGNNSAGVAWVDAVVNSGFGGTTTLPDGDGTGGTVDTAPGGEKDDIESGAVFEHAAGFPIESSGNTIPKVRAALREFYAQEKLNLQNTLKRQLKWFGANESEA